MGEPELKVLRVISQSVVTSLHREIILDVLCIMVDGAYMNIEMQKEFGNDDIKRNRFYAAYTTAAYTPKGTDFTDIPQVTILYITEYDALHNGQMITHMKCCMETREGFVPIDDGEDICFVNTVIRDGSDQSELLQLFLREDVFEDGRFPELSKAVKYSKETEGDFGEMCKTVEDYAKDYEKNYAEDYAKKKLSEERMNTIRKMLQNEFSREMILSLDYSETELEAVEKELPVQV